MRQPLVQHNPPQQNINTRSTVDHGVNMSTDEPEGVTLDRRVTTSKKPPMTFRLSGAGIGGRRKREITEKTRRQTASSGTIPTCENPVTRPGIEPVRLWWEARVLIAQPPWPRIQQHRHSSYVIRRQTVNTCQEVIQPIKRVTDNLKLADALAEVCNEIPATVTDNLKLADALAEVCNEIPATVTDNLKLADALAEVCNEIPATVTDNLKLADALAEVCNEIPATVTDNLKLADALAEVCNEIPATVTDNLKLADALAETPTQWLLVGLWSPGPRVEFVSTGSALVLRRLPRPSDLHTTQHTSREYGAAPECKGERKRDVPEKTRRRAASSDTIPTCGNTSGDPARNRTLLAFVEVYSLSTTPPRPLLYTEALSTRNGVPRAARGPWVGRPCRRDTEGPISRANQDDILAGAVSRAITGKMDVKHVYAEVDFAIGSQFIRHVLDDSETISDLQGNE
ncbi:hypothetical protein PR048_020630 [Dryococelus australis]|uniref:Uncharacterized protein n=1 Tax=Dryococelus australis TaxID=614101 RepID=A0ABQ9H6T3_9NEOP|nr:hypothetical protein PR048_020630 [Dryococelus australis]